jgi:hypothetical protein
VTVRRLLLLICLIASINGAFFAAYQRPDWATEWTDQDGYRRLGEVLASTGQFTRYPDAPRFVPEVIRTPVYPAFVALVYKLIGTSQAAVVAAQIGLFVIICLAVFSIGRIIGGTSIGLAAAGAVALYPPLPYFAALVLTELWTTFVFTLTMWLLIRAVHEQRIGLFVWFGVAAAATALSRPAFFLFLPGIVVMALVLFPAIGWADRPAPSRWMTALTVFAIAMAPWFTYNYVTMHRFTLSPAGGVGRGIWEGSWQGVWPGRVQSELTDIADQASDNATLEARIAVLSARERLAPEPMLTYAHQWQDIRKIWTDPQDPIERANARIAADNEYLRVGLQNSAGDRIGHLKRRLTRGLFFLWSADLPFRISAINGLPTSVIRLCWLAQSVILVLAGVGLWALCRTGRYADALLLAAPIIYITAVHLPFLTEARQSLPAKPVVLTLAVLGAGRLSGRSFTLESQVHEREHR